jgi:N-acetyl-anhydromuramyl-L-alanine amidase AmpD
MDPITIDRTSLRLPPWQYYAEVCTKSQIVLHHTVGGSARSTYNWWMMDRTKSGGVLRVGTAYLVERDGRIFETFDPHYWAHHLGLQHRDNIALNQASIGIEMASEGALQKGEDGRLYCADGRLYRGTQAVELIEPFRGFRYFDAYEEAQIDATIALTMALINQFGISRQCPGPADEGKFGLKFLTYPGVIGHCNVRQDKSDPHPLFPWVRLREALQEAA